MIVVGLLLLVGALIWLFYNRQFGSAGIKVESIPEANVYINGELVGRTPYEGEYQAGEVELQLIALAFDSPRMPYEQNIKLTPGVQTIVRRNLGETTTDTAGEVISFEKNNDNSAAITVVTTPDSSSVTLDNSNTDSSPVRFGNINLGEHQISVSAEGYETRSFEVRAVAGFTLTAIVDLQRKPENELNAQSAKTSDTTQQEQFVVIQETPVGYLRVRSEPTTIAEEISQVNAGDEFLLLETDEETGWYKIRVSESEEGWVSNDYAEIKQQEQE